ncbi:D-alanine--D-alanine ligase [Candidatus Latescibacterota bacterium]
MKIAVFMGGSSPEREVSLNSGTEITKGLQTKGHTAVPYDIEWENNNTLFRAIEEISHDDTDVIYLALHGGLGENGGIQGLLEAAGILYTGSGITPSAIAMDKDISKKLFIYHNIPTAPWIICTSETVDLLKVEKYIGYPCIVKPVDLGSTIGLSLVNNPTELPEALKKSFKFSTRIMIEAYIYGSELTVPILGDMPLPPIEIVPSHKIYDYECKYTPGMTEYLIPAPISDDLKVEIESYALRVFAVLGLRDIARIDFRLDKDGKPLCFEANTLPGMTPTSLVPKSARVAGIEFPELVTRIAEMAYKRRRQQ